jgi:uncharacterized repeat protein (TIGR03803 family)
MKLKAALLSSIWLVVAIAQAGINFTNLFSFAATNGTMPRVALVQSVNGDFYGTTQGGGTNGGYGTIFRLSPDGTLATLISFSGTNSPYLGTAPNELTIGHDGNIYGTTSSGGSSPTGELGGFGTIFRMTPEGTLTTILSFTGTNGPYGGANPSQLVQGVDGGFYGTTQLGGSTNRVQIAGGWFYGYGTIFRWDTNNNFNTLIVFTGTNGACPGQGPYGGLMQAVDFNLYGTTTDGGSRNYGTVFKVSTNGTLLWSFMFGRTNGWRPVAGLVQGKDLDLYGTTGYYSTTPSSSVAGSTIFKITTNGLHTPLVFLGPANFNPNARLLSASDGNLYGLTISGGNGYNGSAGSGYGTVFKMTPAGIFSTLYKFDGFAGGRNPYGGLTQGNDGNFYGVTGHGGITNNGIIYRLGLPLQPKFQAPALTQPSGTFHFTWTAVANQTYQIQFNTSLTSTNWSDLGDPIIATSDSLTATDPTAPDSQRFYRIKVLP